MHFNVKNVLQLDEALHELPIHDSGITSIENEVGNKELLIISEDELFEYELKVSITTAKAQNDKLWLLALKNLKKERKARDK